MVRETISPRRVLEEPVERLGPRAMREQLVVERVPRGDGQEVLADRLLHPLCRLARGGRHRHRFERNAQPAQRPQDRHDDGRLARAGSSRDHREARERGAEHRELLLDGELHRFSTDHGRRADDLLERFARVGLSDVEGGAREPGAEALDEPPLPPPETLRREPVSVEEQRPLAARAPDEPCLGRQVVAPRRREDPRDRLAIRRRRPEPSQIEVEPFGREPAADREARAAGAAVREHREREERHGTSSCRLEPLPAARELPREEEQLVAVVPERRDVREVVRPVCVGLGSRVAGERRLEPRACTAGRAEP